MAKVIEKHANGTVVWQVTDDADFKNNIYCERSYCDQDSKYFIFQRHVADPHAGQAPRFEYIACEFGSWSKRPAISGGAAAVYSIELTRSGELFAMRNAGARKNELLCVNLATGAEQTIVIEGESFRSMTISSDGRYLACGYAVGFSPQMFGVDLIDMATGARKTVLKDPFVTNPHLQFEPRNGKYLLIQYNRGAEYSPDGTMTKLVGPEGATLCVASVPDGKIEWLKLGLPYTPGITGHEDWIPGTGEVILTTCRKQSDGLIPLMKITPGKDACMLSETVNISHVHASECGRYYCGDRYGVHPDERGRTGEIIVGSLKTGKWAPVCRFGNLNPDLRAQYSKQGLWYPDATPYLSPDSRWIVFNDATAGAPQICVASVPESLLSVVSTEKQCE